MRGRFLTLEGPEGAGKTTQAARLVAYLESRGLGVRLFREPGATAAGEAIRDILQHAAAGHGLCAEAETLLFLASRAQLVRECILPALASGVWVVCDRFADSTVAYQGYGRGLDVETIIRMNAMAVGDAVPDLTILLDLDINSGFARLEERNRKNGTGHDRMEREARAFHERVRNGYLALAGRWPERFRIVDADRGEDAVADGVRKAVAHVLG